MKAAWPLAVLVAASLVLAGSSVAQEAEPATPDEAPSPAQPSAQDVEWRTLEPELQHYFCLQQQPPVWCAEWRGRPNVDPDYPILRPDEIPRPRWKPKYWHIQHSVWNALLEPLKQRPPYEKEILTMHVRAFEDGDTVAMEMLGFAFSTGWGVTPNYRRAYEYYGLAYLAGVDRVQPNLDAVWPYLSPEDQKIMRERFARVARVLGRTY